MGSLVSPIFADIIMEDLEEFFIRKSKLVYDITLLAYYRCVDDTFLIFHKNHVYTVINVFNSYNPALKFSFELQN